MHKLQGLKLQPTGFQYNWKLSVGNKILSFGRSDHTKPNLLRTQTLYPPIKNTEFQTQLPICLYLIVFHLETLLGNEFRIKHL